MTREQDFERRLADWLSDGPATAPTEVVDEAIERAAGRRQRHPLWAWLLEPLDRLRASDQARVVVLVAIIALTLLALLAVSLPLGGGPGPAPQMDPSAARHIGGSVAILDESSSAGVTRRALALDVGDPRVDGDAIVLTNIQDAAATGLQRSTGVMRLENAWGAWEGSVNGVRYADGAELEYGWLAGQGAYEGFSYFHHIQGHSTETERTVEGAIWPGEPPPMPDPSLLP